MGNDSKAYRIRAVLDAEEDVIRDIEIRDTATLHELHENLLKAFDLEPGEMATFYHSNENWDQGEEIHLLDFGGSDAHARLMQDVTVDDYLFHRGARMIYVYDLLNLWTFFLENVGETILESEASKIINIKGERPAEAPPKDMEGSGGDEDFFADDEDNEDFYSDGEEDYY